MAFFGICRRYVGKRASNRRRRVKQTEPYSTSEIADTIIIFILSIAVATLLQSFSCKAARPGYNRISIMSPISRDASCAISPSAHLLTRIIRALPQLSSRRGAFVDSSRHERVWTWLCGRILPDADEARQWLDKSKADGSFSSDMRLLVVGAMRGDYEQSS